MIFASEEDRNKTVSWVNKQIADKLTWERVVDQGARTIEGAGFTVEIGVRFVKKLDKDDLLSKLKEQVRQQIQEGKIISLRIAHHKCYHDTDDMQPCVEEEVLSYP